MVIIHPCHIICQGDIIRECDLCVVIRSFNLLQIIHFVKEELDFLIIIANGCITINDNLAVLICGEDQFTDCIVFVKIPSANAGIELELNAGKFLICVISINFDDFESGDSTFTFAGGSIVVYILYGLFSTINFDLI